MNNIDDDDDEMAIGYGGLCVYNLMAAIATTFVAVTILTDTWYDVAQREAYTMGTIGRPSWITSTATLS